MTHALPSQLLPALCEPVQPLKQLGQLAPGPFVMCGV